jgi:hypothetical protein
MLPEPLRGQSDGIPERAPHPEPFRAFAAELLAVVPPLTLVSLSRNGASARAIAGNLAVAAALVSAVTALSSALGDGMQWLALGVGLYAAVSWAQGLALRDPPAFAMIFKNPALLLASTGFAFAAFVGYGVGFWAAPFFIRVHGVSATEAGTALGLAGAAGGWLGVTLGGLISDPWKRTNPNARLWMGIAAAALGAPAAVLVLSTSNLTLAYGVTFLWNVVGAMWIGPAATTANELVLPRMRAMASAFYLLLLTFIGLALGPYTLGRLSDALAARSGDPAEGLRSALRIGVGFYGLAIAFLLAAMRFVPQAEATRLERARAAGEPE